MTYAQYYRELFRLLRGLPDNPVFRATAPWRGDVGMRGWFWLNVTLSIGVLISGPIVAFGTRWNVEPYTQLDERILQWAIAAGVVTTLLNFSLTSPNGTSAIRIEELYLTTIEPRQVAIGFVAWPALLALLLPTSLLLAASMFALANPGTSPLARWALATEHFFLGASALGVALAAAVFSRARFGWRLWTLYVIGPVFAWIAFAPQQVVFEVMQEYQPAGREWSEPWDALTHLAVCALALPLVFREAGRFAGSSFFEQIETSQHNLRDPLRTDPAKWLGSQSLSHWSDFVHDVARVWLLRPSTTLRLIAALVACGFVSGVVMWILTGSPVEFALGFRRVCCAWTLALLMGCQMLAAEYAMLRRGRPILGCSMVPSLLVPHFWLLLCHAAAWGAFVVWEAIAWRPIDEEDFLLFHMIPGIIIPPTVVGIGVALAVGVAANAPRSPIRAAIPAALVLGLVGHHLLFVGPIATFDYVERGPMWDGGSWHLIELMGWIGLWEALLTPGRLTDIYTRLGLGFAEPGKVLYLRRGGSAG